eukprot:3509541-Pyramimonas_sp.AAC.1
MLAAQVLLRAKGRPCEVEGRAVVTSRGLGADVLVSHAAARAAMLEVLLVEGRRARFGASSGC